MFKGCSALSNIVLMNGLIRLGDDMFHSDGNPTSLNSITIPSTITSIGE